MLSQVLGKTLLLSSLVVLTQSSSVQCFANEIPDTQHISAAVQQNADQINKGAIAQLWGKYFRLGTAAFKKNDFNSALDLFGQSMQEAELLGDKARLAESLDGLSLSYQKLGKNDDCLKAAKRSLEVRSQMSGNDLEKISALIKVGNLALDSGDNAGAKTYFDQALNLASANQAAEGQKEMAMDGLLTLAMSNNDFSTAKNLLNTLLEADKNAAASELSARHLELQSRLLFQAGKISDASKSLREALKIRMACQSPDAPEIAALTRNLVRADIMVGNLSDADQNINTVLNFDRSKLAPNSPDYLFDYLSLAELKMRHGEAGAARQICLDVQKALKDSKQDNSSEMADANSLMGQIYANEGQWLEAKSAANQANAIRQGLALPEVFAVNDLETLARVASAQGQNEDAAQQLKKVLEIRQEQFADDKLALSQVQKELSNLGQVANASKTESSLSDQPSSRPQ
jgi:tetratricopeptide (TPR) repeat protein